MTATGSGSAPDAPARARAAAGPGPRAVAALGGLAAGALLIAIGWQKAPGPPLDVTAPRTALLLTGGVLLAVVALAALVRTWARADATGRHALRLVVATTLLAVALALGAAEALLRVLGTPTSAGTVIGPVVLPPTWDETRARNRAVLEGASYHGEEWLTYVVPDAELGWTIGPARGTADGRYASSAEGIRSATPGEAFAARRPALRIALVGDSYAFAMESSFEDSWGARREAALGPDVQVLNFGVDGYGVDQAYLRYRRDVRPWQPDVVLFALIQHDVQRTAAVYPFLSFGWDYPFAKPRFVVEDDRLRLVNVPLPAPAEILAVDDVAALPHVGLDLGYQLADWRWRRGDPPLIGRLFAAALPRWTAPGPSASRPAMAEVSGRVLEAFVADAGAAGSRVRLIYMPTRGAGDFGGQGGGALARGALAARGLDYLDLTGCVAGVPAAARHVPGGSHYSPAANAAVAACIADELDRLAWLAGDGAEGPP